MKVRARAKKIDDLPEWAKCCDWYWKNLHDLGVVILDLDEQKRINPQDGEGVRCKQCKTERPSVLAVRNISTGNFTLLECFDLDEGPLESA